MEFRIMVMVRMVIMVRSCNNEGIQGSDGDGDDRGNSEDGELMMEFRLVMVMIEIIVMRVRYL